MCALSDVLQAGISSANITIPLQGEQTCQEASVVADVARECSRRPCNSVHWPHSDATEVPE
eukprot:5122083-Alexandrium_andersonii.AAC.1